MTTALFPYARRDDRSAAQVLPQRPDIRRALMSAELRESAQEVRPVELNHRRDALGQDRTGVVTAGIRIHAPLGPRGGLSHNDEIDSVERLVLSLRRGVNKNPESNDIHRVKRGSPWQ